MTKDARNPNDKVPNSVDAVARLSCFVLRHSSFLLRHWLTLLFVKNESYLQWLAEKQDAPLLAARPPEYL